ncbi:MAG: DUF4974 domain-containing protein [Chlorobi bacterium]|nr:DUF4974 domain-containing protein [Chlorobiota bacterium]
MIDKNQHSEIFDLISRYFTGEVSESETNQINSWLKESDKNKETFNQYKLLWNNIEKYRIAKLVDVDKEWEVFKSKISGTKTITLPKHKPSTFLIKFTRIAAAIILFIAVGGMGYYLFNNMGKKKYYAKNSVNEIALPDQSKITLNKNARIIVAKDFDKEKREVKLIGEAYFEVNANGKPFIVKTSDIEIKVVGTSFLVNSVKNSETIEVVVNSGIVSVTQINDTTNKVILKKGEKAYFRKKSKELKKLKNTDINFISWKTRKLTFKNDKLTKVVKTLNKIHHANIQIQSTEIKNCRLTASFTDQSLDSILKVIENTLDIKVEKKDNIIYLSGQGCE